jgi:eRF1 domain 1
VQVDVGNAKHDKERKTALFSVRVTDVTFDGDRGSLRISGVISAENRWAPLGSHHTLELNVARNSMQGVDCAVRAFPGGAWGLGAGGVWRGMVLEGVVG